ncbi:threonyl-tRNA synthetase mitochondrial precursor [Coniella lustricola]|uniref:threonine--tRNA ligase n=1 Tax=Coniella lustricola TaxID=2025994 RepID=A0A2T2ZYW8_9PEZI|nr:threonyl-tRNA synthetase mitochondrial precursor [Coniella lustricola]
MVVVKQVQVGNKRCVETVVVALHHAPRGFDRNLLLSLARAPHRALVSLADHGATPATPQTHAKPPADHRDIGIRQELFTTSVYSPGTPILLPAGARIFNRLVDYLRRKYVQYGFQEVITPTIYKKALWAKSGHLENYADDMFTVTSSSPARRDLKEPTQDGKAAQEEEEEEYSLKPMNCPGHCLIFGAHRHSYRDLPIRYADFSPLHRNEISGALSGLTRVRRFHQDDGHIFCRPSQIEDEIKSTLDFVRETYATFKLGPYRLALSTRPEDHYIGTLQEWDQAEAALKSALDRAGQQWTLNPGDGAFYGPKIDIILRDSDGKEHQTATVQLDFQLPKRFELDYEAPAPALEQQGLTTEDPHLLATKGGVRPVMIHRAILGSVERLMALLIEHYDGKWPFWLNPRQVVVITVNDTPPVLAAAEKARRVLLGLEQPSAPVAAGSESPAESGAGSDSIGINGHPSMLTVDLDSRATGVGTKVREAKTKGYGAIVVVGPRNVKSGQIDVNLSGIPVFKDQDKDVCMAPLELRKFLMEQVDKYE